MLLRRRSGSGLDQVWVRSRSGSRLWQIKSHSRISEPSRHLHTKIYLKRKANTNNNNAHIWEWWDCPVGQGQGEVTKQVLIQNFKIESNFSMISGQRVLFLQSLFMQPGRGYSWLFVAWPPHIKRTPRPALALHIHQIIHTRWRWHVQSTLHFCEPRSRLVWIKSSVNSTQLNVRCRK